MTVAIKTLLCLAAICILISGAGLCADFSATRSLQRQQQFDSSSLNFGQSITNSKATNLDTHQRLQLQQLELQQRMQQQSLEMQQQQESLRSSTRFQTQPHAIREGNIRLQQNAQAQERRDQVQQFDLERERQLQQFRWESQNKASMGRIAPE